MASSINLILFMDLAPDSRRAEDVKGATFQVAEDIASHLPGVVGKVCGMRQSVGRRGLA
jgi:hypothetical protein